MTDRFAQAFPYGVPVRPWQIRAEAQDTATMVSAVVTMRHRYRELRVRWDREFESVFLEQRVSNEPRELERRASLGCLLGAPVCGIRQI